MKFKTLKVQNFLSIRNVEINLENRGLLLINGKNNDNESLNNNGSGKSSLLESIIFALYGRTLRGLKGDEVVHNITGKNTRVSLEIEDDDGSNYTIVRYRKHASNKNQSVIFKDNVNITPKSESDFNDLVVKILQSDFVTFTASLLYSSESFKFTMATDAEIKKAFDTMLNLDIFSKCLDKVREEIKKVDGKLFQYDSKIEAYAERIESIDVKLKSSEEDRKKYDTELDEKLEKLSVEATSVIDDIEELQKSVKTQDFELDEYQEKLIESESYLKAVRKKATKLNDLKDELSEAKSHIIELKSSIKSWDSTIDNNEHEIGKFTKQIQSSQSKIEALEGKIEQLNEQIGSPCPTCGKPMDEDSIKSVKEEYMERIQEHVDNIDSYNESIASCKESISSAEVSKKNINKCLNTSEQNKIKIEEKIGKFNKLEQEIEKAEEVVKQNNKQVLSCENMINMTKKEIELKKSLLKNKYKELKELEGSENPFDKIINDLNNEKESIIEESAFMHDDSINLRKAKDDLLFWQSAYSNQGIKSFILDDITPFLNERANFYLGKLTSGRIEVVFSTKTKLKSGEEREKFSVDVINKDGGSKYNSNSGGERKRIDLAINMALQDLVANRSSKKINIAIFDEVFDTLDEKGVEGVVELLQEMSNSKSTILVVSHNEALKSYFTNSITMVKTDGYSRIKE